MKPPLQFSPTLGSHITTACRDAIALARSKNRSVTFLFNGVRMKVHKRLTPRHVASQWDQRLEARSRRYRNSAQGSLALSKRAEDIRNKQQAVDCLLAELPFIVGDEQHLMVWLKNFIPSADGVAVTFDCSDLKSQLEAAGYIQSRYVGHPPEWFTTRTRVARWIVGQVIHCLGRGMPPHPTITPFVDQYLTMPCSNPIS